MGLRLVHRLSLHGPGASSKLKKHLSLWLPVIFAAFHLIVVGGAFLEAGDNEGVEGLAFLVGIYDMPLFVLAKYVHIHGNINSTPHSAKLFILWAGTLIYALVGFLIGALIDWTRRLIARFRDEP